MKISWDIRTSDHLYHASLAYFNHILLDTVIQWNMYLYTLQIGFNIYMTFSLVRNNLGLWDILGHVGTC